MVNGNELDDDHDFLPLNPAPQNHPLEDDDIYYSCDEEDYSDDESEDELEVPHQTIDDSKFPKEPVAYVLFQMVTIFQAGRMTEDDTETMMAMCNLALQSAGEEYRFPKKATTVSNHNQIQNRACSGLMSCPVCVKCSKIFSPNTTARVCNDCQIELFKVSSNVPRKIYLYNSVTTTLKNFVVRPSFTNSLAKWKKRQTVSDRYMDIYDGAVWKTFKTDPNASVPYVEESIYNLMMTLNVDWFQPYKGTQHSTGAIYLTIQNLPRDERNLRKNVLLVGLIPGPSETKVTEISHFLDPLVEELLELKDGVPMHTYANGIVTVKAALTIVGCDLPAAKKVSGFTAINSKNPCHKCHMPFPACPGHEYKRSFANFDMATWVPRTKEETYREAAEWLGSSSSERLIKEALNGTRWT
ncbi:hypothetical protein G6F56_010894 [Rhizopus delemar]|nr:hypothetical protein G6F56_010894 [Rhizopus delemar]